MNIEHKPYFVDSQYYKFNVCFVDEWKFHVVYIKYVLLASANFWRTDSFIV